MEKQIQKKFQTEKGKPCILVEDYKYSESKGLKKCGNIRHNCTNKNCSASLLVDKDVTKVLSMLNEHTHEVIPKNIISRQILSSHLKRKCENDLLTRPNKIIRQELRNTENDIQPVYSDIKLWRKCMYDKRRKNMQQMWHTIINLGLRFDIDIQNSLKCSNFNFDFEKSAHNAVRHFFPNCKIMACRFHLGQSWFKKIQSDSNLLKYYNSKSELGVWLKQLFAL